MVPLPRIHSKLGEVLYSVINGQDTVAKIRTNSLVNTRHSTIMEHLSRLEKFGLLSGTKVGRERIYSVNWDGLIDEFATDFISHEEWLTDFLSRDITIVKKGKESAGRVVAHLPFVSPVIKRRFNEKRYLLQERPLLVRRIQRIMKTNGLVRGFIKDYIKAYAILYWMEPSATLPRCVFEFNEWFVQLASENSEVRQFLLSKPSSEEVRRFVKFLRYLTGDTYVTGINRFACSEAMRKFIVNTTSGMIPTHMT